MADVIIVGGGVIGLSVAWELAGKGADVLVLERGEFGREASWAGAGILPPGNRAGARSPLAKLRAESHALWPEWAAELLLESNVDNGYLRCGGIEVVDPDAVEDLVEDYSMEGIDFELLAGSEIRDLEPRLSVAIETTIRLPELGQIRNPRHMKSLVTACGRRGVTLSDHSPVVRFETNDTRVSAVCTPDARHEGDRICVCGGAWSARLLADAEVSVDVTPVRGQIVQLLMLPLPFAHVIEQGPRYLVPRPDGRILIGSTEEWVGFEKKTTASAISDLIGFATSLVPQLKHATFERAWSGLRPGSSRGRPFLSRVPPYENLFIAAGHFRSGLQMSPASAVFMSQLMLGEDTPLNADDFALDNNAALAERPM